MASSTVRADAVQQQEALNEMQKQIQMLISEVQRQHASGHPQEAGDLHVPHQER